MSEPLVAAVLELLDDDVLALLADRLRPHLEAEPTALLTPAQAAAQLGVHPKTLTRAALAGRVPGARRVGRGWRFEPSTLALTPVARLSASSTPRRRPAARSERSSVAAIRRGARSAA